MSEKLTLERLKQLAMDESLDLSCMQISAIPWRELIKLTRVTHIDLSNNQISEIPPELCSKMTWLKHLDLGRNRVAFLPDNFGDFKNLQYLDLMSNQIEELPNSFSKLTKLKWLNMKDNPLDDSLISTAGRFEEPKFAAAKVVDFAKHQEVLHQKILQNQKETLKKTEAAKKVAAEDPEKAKKKKQKKAKKAEHGNENLRSESEGDQKATAKMPSEGKKAAKPKSPSAFRDIFRYTLWILILSAIISSLVGFLLYDNCTVPAHRWIPKSNEFCIDAEKSWKKRQISPTLMENSKKVMGSIFGVVSMKVNDFFHEVSKGKFSDNLANLINLLHTKLVGAFLFLQRLAVQLKEAFLNLFDEKTSKQISDYLNYAWESIVLSLKIALAVASDFFWTAVDYTAEWIFWSKNFASLAFENPNQAWARVKTYWNLA